MFDPESKENRKYKEYFDKKSLLIVDPSKSLRTTIKKIFNDFGVAVNDIQHWEFDEPKDYDDEVKEANYQTTSVYGFGHPLYYNNVIEVLRGNAEPETDGREGLKSLEVLIAAYLSARDGKTISLPLEY